MDDEFRGSIKINTYKSVWLHSKKTGNYARIQKETYLFENVIKSLKFLFGNIQGLKSMFSIIGRKLHGVDYYRYYSEIIKSGIRGKWKGQFEKIHKLFEEKNIELLHKNIVDISGEPGFFGSDLKKNKNNVIVTAFADTVALAIKKHLDVDSIKFDFQEDQLVDSFIPDSIDVIFSRHGIGFCENLSSFLNDAHNVLKTNGVIYICFSPASRAVCARWMFDDYTYLRQYTLANMKSELESNGFSEIGEWDEGSYDWDHNLHPTQKFFSKPYLKNIFNEEYSEDKKQHNMILLYKKTY